MTLIIFCVYRRARDGEGGPSEAVMFLESSHCDFVLENLLFYTYLFQQMLQRLVRVDFTSTRSAHMLYRITKVYSNIENLKGVLYEIESSILLESTHSKSLNVSPTGINSLGSSSLFTPGSLSSLSRSFAGTPGSANSHVPPDFVISSLKLAHVKQLMRELEGAEFHYSPLFSEDNRIKVIFSCFSIILKRYFYCKRLFVTRFHHLWIQLTKWLKRLKIQVEAPAAQNPRNWPFCLDFSSLRY